MLSNFRSSPRLTDMSRNVREIIKVKLQLIYYGVMQCLHLLHLYSIKLQRKFNYVIDKVLKTNHLYRCLVN